MCSYLQITGIEWNKKRKTADAAIASFEAPKIPSVAVKITLNFVLLIADDSESTGGKSNKNNYSDNDSILVTTNATGTLTGSSSQHEDKVSSNDPKNVDDIDII